MRKYLFDNYYYVKLICEKVPYFMSNTNFEKASINEKIPGVEFKNTYLRSDIQNLTVRVSLPCIWDVDG